MFTIMGAGGLLGAFLAGPLRRAVSARGLIVGRAVAGARACCC